MTLLLLPLSCRTVTPTATLKAIGFLSVTNGDHNLKLSGLRKIDITCSPQDVVTCLRPTTNGDRRLLQLQPQPSPNRLFTPTSTSRCNVLPPSPWFIVLVHSQLINQAARLRPAIFQLLSASFVTAPVGLPLPRTVVSLLGPDKTSTHRVYD